MALQGSFDCHDGQLLRYLYRRFRQILYVEGEISQVEFFAQFELIGHVVEHCAFNRLRQLYGLFLIEIDSAGCLRYVFGLGEIGFCSRYRALDSERSQFGEFHEFFAKFRGDLRGFDLELDQVHTYYCDNMIHPVR